MFVVTQIKSTAVIKILDMIKLCMPYTTISSGVDPWQILEAKPHIRPMFIGYLSS